MKITEQGALRQSMFLHLLAFLLVPLLIGLPLNTAALTAPEVNGRINKTITDDHNIHLIFSHDSKLQSSIAYKTTKSSGQTTSLLYMTQSYCKQIDFIKELNKASVPQ